MVCFFCFQLRPSRLLYLLHPLLHLHPHLPFLRLLPPLPLLLLRRPRLPRNHRARLPPNPLCLVRSPRNSPLLPGLLRHQLLSRTAGMMYVRALACSCHSFVSGPPTVSVSQHCAPRPIPHGHAAHSSCTLSIQYSYHLTLLSHSSPRPDATSPPRPALGGSSSPLPNYCLRAGRTSR